MSCVCLQMVTDRRMDGRTDGPMEEDEEEELHFLSCVPALLDAIEKSVCLFLFSYTVIILISALSQTCLSVCVCVCMYVMFHDKYHMCLYFIQK